MGIETLLSFAAKSDVDERSEASKKKLAAISIKHLLVSADNDVTVREAARWVELAHRHLQVQRPAPSKTLQPLQNC